MNPLKAAVEIYRLLSKLSPTLIADIVLLVKTALSGDEERAMRQAKATASAAASEKLIREGLKRM